jgi:hypothetical protein
MIRQCRTKRKQFLVTPNGKRLSDATLKSIEGTAVHGVG